MLSCWLKDYQDKGLSGNKTTKIALMMAPRIGTGVGT